MAAMSKEKGPIEQTQRSWAKGAEIRDAMKATVFEYIALF